MAETGYNSPQLPQLHVLILRDYLYCDDQVFTLRLNVCSQQQPLDLFLFGDLYEHIKAPSAAINRTVSSFVQMYHFLLFPTVLLT